jgi:hypothetical protein
MSNIYTKSKTGEIGEYPCGTWPSAPLHELTGFGITPTRIQGGRQATPKSNSQSGHHADETVTEPGGYAEDDPWFGKNANPQRINTPS